MTTLIVICLVVIALENGAGFIFNWLTLSVSLRQAYKTIDKQSDEITMWQRHSKELESKLTAVSNKEFSNSYFIIGPDGFRALPINWKEKLGIDEPAKG